MSKDTEAPLRQAGEEYGRSGAERSVNATSEAEPDGMSQYEDMQSLMDAQDGGFRSLRRRQTTKGVVVSIGEDAVLVDVGTKSEGIIPREELAEQGDELPQLHYGQEVLVQVLEPESPQGPVLSLKGAARDQAWMDMEECIASGRVITAPVVDHNRGGALVDVRGLRGFVPLSHLASLPPGGSGPDANDTQDRLAQLIGRQLSFKVLEANRGQNRLILSERAADQEERARRRSQTLADLRPGQIRRGVVRNVTNFGAFVDLGGADGLIHISEMSYDRIQNPRSIVQPGQEIDVYVLDVRSEDQKVALSLKKAMADPWESIEDRLQPGQTVNVVITRLAKFGAFAQVEPGVEGLIHISELTDVPPREPGQIVQEGQEYEVKVIHIDRSNRRLGLSLRQMLPVEIEMTAGEWHEEQESTVEASPSAFGALSSMVETLPESETIAQSVPETQSVPEAQGGRDMGVDDADESPKPVQADETAAVIHVEEEGNRPIDSGPKSLQDIPEDPISEAVAEEQAAEPQEFQEPQAGNETPADEEALDAPSDQDIATPNQETDVTDVVPEDGGPKDATSADDSESVDATSTHS